jgi:hypothetical protein
MMLKPPPLLLEKAPQATTVLGRARVLLALGFDGCVLKSINGLKTGKGSGLRHVVGVASALNFEVGLETRQRQSK